MGVDTCDSYEDSVIY